MRVFKYLSEALSRSNLSFKILWLLLVISTISVYILDFIVRTPTFKFSDYLACLIMLALFVLILSIFIWAEDNAEKVEWKGVDSPKARGSISKLILRISMLFCIYASLSIILK